MTLSPQNQLPAALAAGPKKKIKKSTQSSKSRFRQKNQEIKQIKVQTTKNQEIMQIKVQTAQNQENQANQGSDNRIKKSRKSSKSRFKTKKSRNQPNQANQGSDSKIKKSRNQENQANQGSDNLQTKKIPLTPSQSEGGRKQMQLTTSTSQNHYSTHQTE